MPWVAKDQQVVEAELEFAAPPDAREHGQCHEDEERDQRVAGHAVSVEALGMFVPRLHHLVNAVYWAFALTIARHVFNWIIFKPIGRLHHLRETPARTPSPNPALEAIFKKARGKPRDAHISEAVKASGLDAVAVQKWFHLRRQLNQPTVMDKYCEALWRFVFYSIATIYGFVVLWDKSWFADQRYTFLGFGFQECAPEIRYYYYFEIGMYLSLLFSLSTDTKRKDFVEMTCHHIVTILLMTFSWSQGYFRIGTLILLVHDFADIFLELAKTALYLKYQNVCDAMFAVFAVAFGVSRIIIFPFWNIRGVYDSHILTVNFIGAQYFYLVLLGALQVLHIFWFQTIVRMVFMALKSGEVSKDDRSDDEDDEEEEQERNKTKKLGKSQ